MRRQILSFDLTGTLATFSFCNSIYFKGLPRLYAAKYDISFEQSKKYLIECYDEIGDQQANWYDITYWFKRFDLGDGWNSLLNELSSNIEYYSESKLILEELNREYDMVLTTNACREFVEIETVDIKSYFTRIISCVSDFGEVKKTPEFYGKICRLLKRSPEEIIHIGDNWLFDYIAPKEHGLTAIYIDRSQETRGEFVIHNLNELKARLL